SRPTGRPPRGELASQPERQSQRRADDDAHAQRALGWKRQRIEEPSVDDRRAHAREEQEHRDRAAEGAAVAKRARARRHQRRQPPDAVPPLRAPLGRLRLEDLLLDVGALLAADRAGAGRAVERRIAIAPAAVAEGAAAAPAFVGEAAAPTEAVQNA